MGKLDILGGGQAGYNWQTGVYVAGIEGDFDYLGLKKSSTASGPYPCCGPTTGFTINSSISPDWLATIRGRLGVASDSLLFYVTGGLAFTDLKANYQFADLCGTYAACGVGGYPVGFETASISAIKAGYAIGGGIETKLQGNWSVKVEYLYVNFGNVSTGGLLTGAAQIALGSNNNPFTNSANLSASIVRLGLNYKIN